MPRHPDDESPEPPGGRAAERRQATLKGRFPERPELAESDVPESGSDVEDASADPNGTDQPPPR